MNAGTRIFPDRPGTGSPKATRPMLWAPAAAGAEAAQLAADVILRSARTDRVDALVAVITATMEAEASTADEIISAVALIAAKIGQGANPHSRLTFDTLRAIQERHLVALGLGFGLAAVGSDASPSSQSASA